MFADIVYKSGHEYIQSFEDIQAAILVIIPCLIGPIMAIIVIRGCFVIPAMQSSFGYLTRYEMSLRILACLNSGGFYLFGVLLDIKLILNNSQIFGLISATLLPMIYALYFLISINRFLAIVTPKSYSEIFSPKNRRIYISVFCISPIIYTPTFAWYYDCGYKFYHYGWVFSFIISDTCGTKFEVLLRGFQSFFACLMLIFDFGTLIALLCFGKCVLNNKSSEFRKSEINFGQQVVIQGFVSILYGVFYSYAYQWIPGNLAENWKIFWTSSFLANILHFFDTGVIFVFNAEFTRWLRGRDRNKILPVGMVISVVTT
ncbi:unnamed protein product [Caenorhabditis angaria]|uniref:7TM GPCR serpentine receptor class x (Srx) domain-containing protein n=1 Tax=Caenorhabditis angaria TaxID=860376 RepID=A0A9P1IWV2_9PELO|nr:unnamed protein product [Caenorhabditis angaria]